ncbi:hypothetical protein IOQ59_11805 [Pontibacterium sp. N1Y112]|uniref:YtkA-like domain-containing protein n=1 Tax=Pontibacterium sinense TaxID=2781979 RepID=A0A8J7FDA4_9GAMM|nr:hypothetical protein [Pontibacterium sinense]MBE9397942.1 hypothetical protein [Pontibacterium sinense]
MSNRLLQYAIFCVLALSLGVAVIWLPEQLKPQASGNQLFLSDSNCSIKHSDCSATLDTRSIVVDVSPREIRSAVPLTFNVTLDGIDATEVNLSLEGQDMYMGLNQISLIPVANQPGVWSGVTELAICTTGEMSWRARIVAQQDQQQLEAHFDFTAK